MNLLEMANREKGAFAGYRIKGIDIDRLPELTEELTEKPDYDIVIVLESIEEVSDDSVEISPTPSGIWQESFRSIYPGKVNAFKNQVGHRRHIYIGLTTKNGFNIDVQGFDIGGIAEHSQFFIDLVDAVNKQALSEIEKKVQEKQKKEKAEEDFRKKAEQINTDCFPGTPTSE